MKTYKTVGARIRAARTQAGFETAHSFARAIDVHDPMLSRYETDRGKPSADILARIARTAKCSMYWLMTGDQPSDDLRCPTCNFEFCHVLAVTTWRRAAEDGFAVSETICLGPTNPDRLREAHNPSERRSGVVLHCVGECGHRFELTFANHKGRILAGLVGDDN